jgi:hypothetical protein
MGEEYKARADKLSKSLKKIEKEYSETLAELAVLRKRVKELREALDKGANARPKKGGGRT